MTPVLNPQLLIKSVECCLVQSNCGQCPLNRSDIKFPMCQTHLGNAVMSYMKNKEDTTHSAESPKSDESIEDDESDLPIAQENIFLLSAKQCKMMLYIASKINWFNRKNDSYDLYINEFCAMCNEILQSGENRKDAKSAIEKLAKMAWINVEHPVDGKRAISVRIHNALFPLLRAFRLRCTYKELTLAMQMKSKYGIRLWAMLISGCEIDGKYTIDLSELKKKLDANTYTRFADFRRFVLDIAVDDVNNSGCAKITYHTHTIPWGRSIERITFEIKRYQEGAW